jgi:23S rRNA (guanosine2251-2'-O)-methyltransferase
MNRRPPRAGPSSSKPSSSKPSSSKPSSSKPSSSKPSSSKPSSSKPSSWKPSSSQPSSPPRSVRPGRPPSPSRSPTSGGALAPLSSEGSVFGRHAVEATLRHQPARAEVLYHLDNPDLRPLVELAQQHGVDTVAVEADDLDDLVGGRERASPQGVVLRCGPFPYADVEDFDVAPALTLVLDGVEDPRNLGAAARAACVLGAGLVVVPADRAAAATAAAIKTSAGALCRVPLARATNLRRALEQLKQKGAWIVGAEADGDRAPWQVEVPERVVVVVGGEDRG